MKVQKATEDIAEAMDAKDSPNSYEGIVNMMENNMEKQYFLE